MTAPLLADALGRRGRRHVLIASVVAGLAVLAVLALAVKRLQDKGQLDADRWEPLMKGTVLRFLLGGLGNTLKAAAVAMVLAVVLGALLALGRLARNRPVRWGAGAYVDFFRAMPLLLLILFTFLALPAYGVHLPNRAFWTLVIALVAYNGAVLGEIFRAGILSLDRGQSEAAFAIGLGYWATMMSVIVPQAVRRMVPAIVSQLVTLLKDTSLGFVIGYDDLLGRVQQTGTFFGNVLQGAVLAVVVYIIVNSILSRVAQRLEVRQRQRYGARRIDVGGIEDLAVLGAKGTAEGV